VRNKNLLLFVLSFLITVAVTTLLMSLRVDSGMVKVLLPAGCQVEYYSRQLQPVETVVFGCPRMDGIRLWPWPIQQPWFEDSIRDVRDRDV